ncbi:CDP-glycerol glycerophosphotransferase (TagB/SpsB family) [Conyzicola nivalis]|uniref:CDP-glycerol glycerophosphotransferase (TagB/SpsB family) n=1 Tax=Conyzicola nivalis TaxID=1477021 RepID=A0ABV2QHW4_9MICO
MPETTPAITFAAGNAKKLLALPGYALGAVASLLVPRRRDLWVFGSGPGIGEGALALYRVAERERPGRRLLWLARDESDLATAARLSIPAVLKSSRQGLWATLRARVIVVTHGFGDANRYGITGGFVVQLWHGIPLKRINLDSAETLRTRLLPDSALLRRMLRLMYRRAARSIDILPAASEVSARRLRTAFDLPNDRVVVTGDPRDDVLLRGEDAERSAAARALVFERLGIAPSDSRILLYAPTWRDGEADPGIPTDDEWRRIAALLDASDSILLVRPHPHGVGDYAAGPAFSDRVLLFDSRLCTDVTPALPAVDMLITDYSSIAYDFALTGRPIVFLAPDVDAYTASRGLYVAYPTFSGGSETASWSEALDLIERADTAPATRKRLAEHSESLATAHHAYRDGLNTDRVYREITTRLKEHE